MTDVVTAIHYRLIRPDGTLLWTATAPSNVGPPAPPVRPGFVRSPDDWVRPPWRYEQEVNGKWTLIGEHLDEPVAP